MTKEIILQETLQEKLDAIKRSITKGQWKYYHIEAIDNFIYHLKNLPSERTQQRVAGCIQDYLANLSDKISKEQGSFTLAKELAPHIWKISDVYRCQLHFVGKPFYLFHIVLWTILFFVFRNAFSTTIALIAVAAIGVSTITYYQLKIKSKKYY
jgi:hypothetical protein